jgi:hypothetical protein
MVMSMRRRTAAALALLAGLAGLAGACTGGGPGTTRTPATASPSGPGSSVSPGSSAGPGRSALPGCPASYAAPDPARPRIRLSFDLAEGLGSVKGSEHVEFTPDLPVRELVFRLTANTAPSVAKGNSVAVESATVAPDGAGPFRVEPAGAGGGTQGGLLVLPLGREVPAGQLVSADIAFTLKLGEGAFDRFGHLQSYAWWGSGQPLLAWERGVGWHREPLLRFLGESATSEAANIDLTVTAPARLTVLASGTPDPPVDAGGGRRRWHFASGTARDVSVAAGPYAVKEGTVDGVRLRVGTPPGRAPDDLYAEHARAVRELAKRFGPFPFPVLSVARLPLEGGGIEYPGSILMLAGGQLVAVHETAHQWFYGMVGDSQARDPWLDEAFATYAEQQVNGTQDTSALNLPGRVSGSMQDFGGDMADYYTTVYGKGGAALAAARTAAGPAKFDAALRCYVNANAWRIARPADLARALATLPAALSVLRKAGALR